MVASILARAKAMVAGVLAAPNIHPPAEVHRSLDALCAKLGMLNILQIGANDGVINDPLYRFVSAYPDRTRIILVEPQAALIAPLFQAYAFHPAKRIFQGAIGREGSLALHGVRSDCWADLVVPYAKGWPMYRAPTGIASARREMVVEWVERHYRGPLAVEEVVEVVEIESLDVPALLKRVDLFSRPDVLVVDAEGWDDEVIYLSDIDGLRPSLIYFEIRHLDPSRLTALASFLAKSGYEIRRMGGNALAERRCDRL